MTTYYVSASVGSDSNNGLGPDASHATNKPWKTIGKLIGASGFASGDTAYLYGTFRESVTAAMTSATAETKIIGDVANAQGFKDGSGVLLSSGPVVWTGYVTDDRSIGASASTLTLSSRDYLTFQSLVLVSANGTIVTASATSTNITFTDCAFLVGHTGANNAISITGAADIALNWVIDRCCFLKGSATAIVITLPTSASADYDVNVLIRSCLFVGGNGATISVTASGAASFKAGGVDMLCCVQVAGGNAFATASANIATSIPCTVYGCYIYNGTTALNANTSGQITEDYNGLESGSTPRTNVTVGKNSYSAGQLAPLIHIGQELLWGGMLRPFGAPMPASGLLGLSDYGSTPAVDLSNRPRPSGGGSATAAAAVTGTATTGGASTLTDALASWTTNAFTGYIVKLTGGTGSGQLRAIQSNTGTVLTVTTAWTTNPDVTSTYSIDNPGKYYAIGAYERHDAWVRETTTVRTGANALRADGPGDHDFLVPVDAVSTTVSVYMRYDSTHGSTNKPQVQVVGGSECGVTDATATMTASADTWEQISLTFTPTSKGIVTIRLVSRAAAGNGKAYADDFDVA